PRRFAHQPGGERPAGPRPGRRRGRPAPGFGSRRLCGTLHTDGPGPGPPHRRPAQAGDGRSRRPVQRRLRAGAVGEGVMSLAAQLAAAPVARWRTRRAVVLDWYDGPREGVCALAEPACEFYFELLDERPTADDLDDRLFRLSALPPGSVAALLACLAGQGEPAGPVWVPVWRFADAA